MKDDWLEQNITIDELSRCRKIQLFAIIIKTLVF
jgi:hypothetical protein